MMAFVYEIISKEDKESLKKYKLVGPIGRNRLIHTVNWSIDCENNMIYVPVWGVGYSEQDPQIAYFMYQEIVNTVLVYYSKTGSKELGYTIDVTVDRIRIDKRLVDQKEKIVESVRKAIEEFMIKVVRVVNNAYELNKINFLNIEDPQIIKIRDTGMGTW